MNKEIINMNEIDKMDITNKQLLEEKSHWDKYKLYYLVFGSAFFTTVIILVSNSTTNKQIRNLKMQLENSGRNQESFDDYKPKHEYSSEFTEPDPREKNES